MANEYGMTNGDSRPESVSLTTIGSINPVSGPGVIASASGNNLVRGSVLGRITANGKYTAWNPSATNGSQTIAGILVDAVNATSADKNAEIYTIGVFNIEALNAGSNVISVGIYNNGTIIITQEVQ